MWRLSFLALPAVVLTAMALIPAQAACDFAAVKNQIDTVLDKDTARAEKFRREVASGADSIAVLESLVAPEMAKKIDICRFETAEYLTKRGFPPFH
ncbi:MAG: hypothetical protein K2Y27_19960 [Xanthobacteraceae bacterium]|nr:hypothetical protein [Xanthobacteraceae bacterium]